MALRVNALRAEPPATGWRLADPLPETRLTDARKNVLAALADGQPRTGAELARAAEVSPACCAPWPRPDCCCPPPCPSARLSTAPTPPIPARPCRPIRQQAAAALRAAAGSARLFRHLAGRRHRFGQDRSLSGGDRGSACGAGRQALVLLPEIALSAQWLDRFAQRFGVAPAVWHSDLSSRVRRTTWRAVDAGAASGGGGRPLGAVPAVPRSGPGHRRRGARDRVQAGGRRGLPRPRHGGGARPAVRGAGGAGLGHAQPGDGRQRARPAATAACICPTGMAAPCCRRSRWSICATHAARARPVPGAPAGRGGARHASPAASRRCCSSTAAAMRR